MTDAMDVDAQASLIMAWVGPMPHSVHQEPALAHLKRTYKVSTIVNKRSVNGIRFYKVAFATQEDLASAIEKSPTFFRGQFLRVFNDLHAWLNDRSAADKNIQVLCNYKSVRHLPNLLAKGRVIFVDNCRARTFSRVLWHYEKQQDAADAAALAKLAVNGHDLLFFAGSARLCYSCGESGHVKSSCPTKLVARTPPPGQVPIFVPSTSASGASYADAAKQAIEKVDRVDKDLRAQVADLAGQVSAMQELLNKFCAQQDVLLSAIKLEQDKLRKDVAELEAHRAETSARYKRVNRDLAIVEVDLEVVLDELWESSSRFEKALMAARKKSWAYQAWERGSVE